MPRGQENNADMFRCDLGSFLGLGASLESGEGGPKNDILTPASDDVFQWRDEKNPLKLDVELVNRIIVGFGVISRSAPPPESGGRPQKRFSGPHF